MINLIMLVIHSSILPFWQITHFDTEYAANSCMSLYCCRVCMPGLSYLFTSTRDIVFMMAFVRMLLWLHHIFRKGQFWGRQLNLLCTDVQLRNANSSVSHRLTFTFFLTFNIFIESKRKNTAAKKHKKTEQRNNVEHKEITSKDKEQENQTHFYSLISLWVTRFNREGLLRDRGPANGAHP